MNKRLFFAFSAFLDEMQLDPREMIKIFMQDVSAKQKTAGKAEVNAEQKEAMVMLLYTIVSKVHKAKTTYIPFVSALLNCSEAEEEKKDVEEVLKIAFSNNDVKSFFR